MKSAAGKTLPLHLRTLALAAARVTNDHPLGNGALGPWVHVTLLLGGVTDIR